MKCFLSFVLSSSPETRPRERARQDHAHAISIRVLGQQAFPLASLQSSFKGLPASPKSSSTVYVATQTCARQVFLFLGTPTGSCIKLPNVGDLFFWLLASSRSHRCQSQWQSTRHGVPHRCRRPWGVPLTACPRKRVAGQVPVACLRTGARSLRRTVHRDLALFGAV